MYEINQYSSDFRGWLLSEYRKKKETNSSYSLRAFAKFLEISPPALSQVLSGKRKFSRINTLKVAKRFSLSPIETKELIKSVHNDGLEEKDTFNELQLKNDEFLIISDWYHLAILSLAKLKQNKADLKWISDQLGISVLEARDALLRLKRRNFIKEESGRLVRALNTALNIEPGVTSSAIQKYHKQNFKLAEKAMEVESLEHRKFSSVTMALDPKKLGEAEKMITHFKKKLARFLESGEKKRVYTLSIQLFPVSKQTKE